MSCLPLGDNVPRNVGYAYGSDLSAEQTCQQSRDEAPADSEKGLELFCEPILLYESILNRAKHRPSFLRRDLRYKIDAKQRKRIKITISLSRNTNAELQARNIFPLYILFATSISDVLVEGHSPLYQFNQAHWLTSFNESGSNKHSEATIIIPDLETLATTRACNSDIILVSCGHVGETFDEINCSEDYVENFSLQELEGKCFWGKIPVSFLRSSLDNCTGLLLGCAHKFASTIVMTPGFIEPNILEQDCRLVFCSRKFNDMCSYELRVSISAEEAGAKYILKSPYNFYSYIKVPHPSMDIVRLGVGNVLFNYMYGNNMCKQEGTADFTCSFCFMKCGNFKGLECHLLSSHDRFNFEFKISNKEQAVNVRVKHHTNELFPEAAVDPRHDTFSYFSKYKKYGRLAAGAEVIVPSGNNEVVKPAQPVSLGSKSLEYAQAGFEDSHVQKDNGISVPGGSAVPDDSLHCRSLPCRKVQFGKLQFGKARKLRVDQFGPPKRDLLQKRQMFHSRNGQEMAFEELLSDNDSEGEIDDEVVDLEERVAIETYSNVGEEEKLIMHMWNSFVRRQRIVADGHVRWGCIAFSEQHGQLMAHKPKLRWYWRFLLVKFWNHGLVDARTIDTCNRLLDEIKNKSVIAE